MKKTEGKGSTQVDIGVMKYFLDFWSIFSSSEELSRDLKSFPEFWSIFSSSEIFSRVDSAYAYVNERLLKRIHKGFQGTQTDERKLPNGYMTSEVFSRVLKYFLEFRSILSSSEVFSWARRYFFQWMQRTLMYMSDYLSGYTIDLKGLNGFKGALKRIQWLKLLQRIQGSGQADTMTQATTADSRERPSG